MKVLITGTNGFLGNHLLHYLDGFNYQLSSITRNSLVYYGSANVKTFIGDLTNEQFVYKVINEVKPNVIIHCAAMSKPDDCEKNKLLCRQTNVGVTENLVTLASKLNAHFIFCSTDFVYGEGDNHLEEAACNPLNYYAKSKVEAEKLVKQISNNYCIIRPVFMYGKEIVGVRKSFVQWVKENVEKGTPIKVVNDQFRMPTYVVDVCKAIEKIIANKKNGTFNIAGTEILTPYQMAISVANRFNLPVNLITPVTEKDFKEPVKRAKKSTLNVNKAKVELQFEPITFSNAIKLL